MSETTVFCKECVYSKRSLTHIILAVDFYRCTHPSSRIEGELDFSTGEKEKDSYRECNTGRRLAGNFCGQSGSYWEPKNTKKNLLTYLKRI